MKPSMGKAELPNQPLIRELYKTYFSEENQPAEQSQFVSSYWEYHSEFIDVKVDEDGNPVSLFGGAIPGCRWGGLGGMALTHLCYFSHLTHLPHRREIIRLRSTASRICSAMGLNPTQDVLRQVYSLEMIKRNLPAELFERRLHVMVIGDGCGILSALFKAALPNSTVVLVDIGRTLLFQSFYCQRAHPSGAHRLAQEAGDPDQADFIYCPTEHLEALQGIRFDVAVNINSMAEMNYPTIERYFTFLRDNMGTSNLFYCANRETKTLPGGELLEFDNYPWEESDKFLVDGNCLWNRYRFAKASSRGPQILGVRVPIVQYYAGNIRHRLTVLSTR